MVTSQARNRICRPKFRVKREIEFSALQGSEGVAGSREGVSQ